MVPPCPRMTIFAQCARTRQRLRVSDDQEETDRYWNAIVGNGEGKRAFDAMMTMGKIDVATIEAARRG
jgi:predicted 3-demethylubiquinone-9 3-methyltransferase (glyoxalase superfamily)